MKNKKAFTLVELLVVIAIIGILATLAIVALQQARQNSRDAKRVADVKQMSTALEMYFNEHQSYPDSLDDLEEAGYMQMIPEAPTPADKGCEDSNDYNYSVSSNKDYYQLRFCTGKQVADLSPGNLCMTPGGLSTDCSATALAPDPDPFCDPNEPVTFVDEDGNGYYDIHTCCELNAIRNNPSANYELVNNLDCSNTENWSQDIDGTTYEGFPTIIDFAGNLKGNNNTISGLYFIGQTNSYSGMLTVATEANVAISDIKFSNAHIDSLPNVYEAAIIAPLSRGNSLTINNCAVINSAIVHGGRNSSAFVGYVESGNFSINNSYIDNLSAAISGFGFGSFVGDVHSSPSAHSITNSYIKNSTLNAANCGGLGGVIRSAHYTTIDNVYLKNIEYMHGNSFAIGGIALWANNNSSIKNSYVENSRIEAPTFASGFSFGFHELRDSNVENVHVKNSSITMTGEISDGAFGLAREIHGSIVKNSYTENLTITDVNSVSRASGFIGDAYSSQIYDSHVRNLTLTGYGGALSGLVGNIRGAGNIIERSSVVNANLTETSSHTAIGGLVANVSSDSNVSISDSYFIGDLNVTGSRSVSGVVAEVSGSGEVVLNRVFAEANISAPDFSSASCLSKNSSSFSGQDNYYNSDVCVYGVEGIGSPLSTSEMKDPSSYSNWNINTPSCSEANEDNPWRQTLGNYPCLYSDSACKCS